MTGFEGLPNGTRAAVYLETRDDAGELVNEQYVTFFVRGFDDGRKVGELSPEHRFDEALREQAPVLDVTQRIDDDQTYRYAEASGDPMPIHTRRGVRAQRPGCRGSSPTGSASSRSRRGRSFESSAGRTSAACAGSPCASRSRSCPARRSTRARGRTRGGAATYAFETTVDGTAVLRDGLAVLADPA